MFYYTIGKPVERTEVELGDYGPSELRITVLPKRQIPPFGSEAQRKLLKD